MSLVERGNGLEEWRQDRAQLRVATARQKGENGPVGVESVTPTERLAIFCHPQAPLQGMTDIVDLDPVRFVEGLLEGQDHQHSLDGAPDRADAVGPPRPDLRADVVDDAVAVAMKGLRQAQVELWPIDEDDERRSSFPRGSPKLLEDPPEIGQRPDDLRQPHDGEFPDVDERLDARRPHLRSPGSEDLPSGVRLRAQRLDQVGSVPVPGRLTGYHHQSRRCCHGRFSRAAC